jgi:hypothetical protein
MSAAAGKTMLITVPAIFVLLMVPAWWLGDAFRRFTKPDWITTSGAMNTFYVKLFWMFGPQCPPSAPLRQIEGFV